jgi:23S rRNA (guanosine2251-2'-O)-methyltransferase
MPKKISKISHISSQSPNKRRPVFPPQNVHFVVGRKPVREMIRYNAGRILELYLTQEAFEWMRMQKDGNSAEGRIDIEQFSKRILAKDEISAMVMVVGSGGVNHQGCLALTKPRNALGTTELMEALSKLNQSSIFFVLAGITDVHNFGAILRVAHCFGAQGIVIPKNRSVGLSPAVSRVSAGASEFIPVYAVPNLSQAIIKAQDEFNISSVALTCSAEAVPIDTVSVLPSKMFLVLGSEAEGIPQLLQSRCRLQFTIPMAGKIDSINVAQAAAVFTWHWSLASREKLK